MTIKQLDKLNEEHLFSKVTEDMKRNIYLKCKDALIGKTCIWRLALYEIPWKNKQNVSPKVQAIFIIDVEVA